MVTMSLAEAYNRHLISAIMKHKVGNPELKRQLRANGHSAIDADSPAYLEHAASTLDESALDALLRDDWPAMREGASAFEPLPGIPIAAFAPAEPDATPPRCLFALAALAATSVRERPEGALARAVIAALSGQRARADAILDDDIAGLLRRADIEAEGGADAQKRGYAAVGAGADEGGATSVDALMEGLRGSKLGALAAEISNEVGGPRDFAEAGDMDGLLGNIVSKVGSKIQNKIASGEVSHEELLKEAFGFLSTFQACGGVGGNSPDSFNPADLMQTMMRSMVQSSALSKSKAFPSAKRSQNNSML